MTRGYCICRRHCMKSATTAVRLSEAYSIVSTGLTDTQFWQLANSLG